MVSDTAYKKICKKCGGPLVYWHEEYVRRFGPVNMLHDHRWSSNNPDPENIDPNYVPR
jgi:hypothetical protein